MHFPGKHLQNKFQNLAVLKLDSCSYEKYIGLFYFNVLEHELKHQKKCNILFPKNTEIDQKLAQKDPKMEV